MVKIGNIEQDNERHRRHGDLILKKIDTLPERLHKIQSSVLAEGETTGHKHQLLRGNNQITVYEDSTGNMYVESKEGGTLLVHEEHNAIPVPAGLYLVGHEQEFNPFENIIVRVRD